MNEHAQTRYARIVAAIERARLPAALEERFLALAEGFYAEYADFQERIIEQVDLEGDLVLPGANRGDLGALLRELKAIR